MVEATASAVKVTVPSDKVYAVRLNGAQLKLLLRVFGSAHCPVSQAHLVASTLDALQEPLLEDAHGTLPNHPPAT